MSAQDLESRFEAAIIVAENMSQAELPQDIQLRLYAYYKRATSGTPSAPYNTNIDLRNAFKTNAWMQISHLSIDEAKEMYIEMIETLRDK